jgi:hypothetical protein
MRDITLFYFDITLAVEIGHVGSVACQHLGAPLNLDHPLCAVVELKEFAVSSEAEELSSREPTSGATRVAEQYRPIAVLMQNPCAELVAKWLRAGGLDAVPCQTSCEYSALAVECTLLETGFEFEPGLTSYAHDIVQVEVGRPGQTSSSGTGFSLPRDLGRLLAHLRSKVGEERLAPLSLAVCGSMVLNPMSREVCTSEGEVTLTAVQFDLLWMLSQCPGTVYSADELQEKLTRLQTHRRDPAVVRYHVARLRSRLGVDGDCIQNVRGCGYRVQTSRPLSYRPSAFRSGRPDA